MMNPVLVFLILVGAVILWLTCSSLYKPIGKLFKCTINKAKNEMFNEEDSNEDKENKY